MFLVATETIAERMEMDKDLGLLPPAVKPVTLTSHQVSAIDDCSAEEQRKWFLTCRGNSREGKNQHFSARSRFRKFQNETKTVLIVGCTRMKRESRTAHLCGNAVG